MSQFYKKYKNLFLHQDNITKRPKSYLKPIQREMAHRVQFGNHVKYSQSLQQVHYKPHQPNRFQSEVLPQISRLNKRNQKYLHSAEPAWIYATPEVRNKYKKMEKPIHSNITFKKSYDEVEKFVEQPVVQTRTYDRNRKVTFNPEQKQQTTTKDPKPKTRHRNKVSTQPDYNSDRSQIDPLRKDYGYPQINYGLIFSEYQTQNQFRLLDKRIKDIRWIQKFYPRGNLNMYREALLRRKDFKLRINERRQDLKKLLEKQQKQYEKKLSII